MAGGMDAVFDHPAVKVTEAGQKGNILSVDGMSLLGFGLVPSIRRSQSLRK